jgi:hypothetical protein
MGQKSDSCHEIRTRLAPLGMCSVLLLKLKLTNFKYEMKIKHHVWKCFLLTALFFTTSVAQVSLSRQSIQSASGFVDIRPCAQVCLFGDTFCSYDMLASAVGCDYDCSAPALNSCYCRPDSQLAAATYLPSCVRSTCTGGDLGVDVTGALSVYQGYCNSHGLTAAQATSPPTTSAPGSSVGNPAPPTATVTNTVYVKANFGIPRPPPTLEFPIFIFVRYAIVFGIRGAAGTVIANVAHHRRLRLPRNIGLGLR